MKKLFILLIAIVANVGTMFAGQGSYDGIYYYFYGKYLGYHATVIAPYNNNPKYSGNVVIPSSVKHTSYDNSTYTVTEIGSAAFSGCTDLISVVIPNSVKEIASEAFRGCSSLTSIALPTSLTKIGKYAFSGCNGLNSTSISVPSVVTEIGTEAFYGVKNLVYTGTATGSPWGARCVNGHVEDGLVYRDASKTELLACFTSVSGNIAIPNSVTIIGEYAFSGCTELTSVIIPESVTSIKNGAFSGCTSMTSITIPNSVTQIGDYAFSGCTGLTSIIIPNSITKIGYHWFSGCTGLVLIMIPNSVTEISYSFDGCTGLTSITIPNSVKTISNDAFLNCSSLMSITIPESITSIGGTAFSGCVNLPVFDNIRYADTYLVEAVDKSLSTYIIKDGTKWISSSAFKNCSNMTSIKIPKSVISFADGLYGNNTFDGCNNLRTVTLDANSIVEQNYSTSWNSKYLSGIFGTQVKEYIIGNSVSRIGNYAFYGCTDLTSITLYDSIISIGSGAFESCSSLPSIIIPNSVTQIGNEAFKSCSSLTSITIPNSVTQLGSGVFANCGVLTAINVESDNLNYCDVEGVLFNKSKTTLMQYPMMKNSESYSIPESTSLIYTEAFYNCNRLSSVAINSKVNIQKDAFYNCNNLTSVHINDIATWCENTFSSYSANPLYYAHHLYLNGSEVSELVIPDGVTSLNNYVFYNCTNLKSVTIPNSITKIGNNAFYGTNVELVKMETVTPPYISENIFPKSCKIYVPLGTLQTYKQASGWSKYWNNNIYIFDLSASIYKQAPTSVSIKLCEDVSKSIASCGMEGGEEFAGNLVENIGLDPETEYNDITFFIKSIKDDYETINVSFSTTSLELTTQPSKAVSATTAILLAETNMADAETNCGFEYKRNDAPEDFTPTKVYCPVASGQMAGRLKNLKDDVYYKYRAFYESTSGKQYYGEWKYIFTGDIAVEFDPILYTYGATIIGEREATINGYALAGSEDFTEQGFEYWAESRVPRSGNAPLRMPAAYQEELGKHHFVQAKGITMRVTLSNLDPGTVYKYRVYATVGNDTITGSEMSFSTQGIYYEPTYIITFVNWDGEILQSAPVTTGTMPEYTGVEPTRPNDEKFTYIFSGWSPELVIVTEAATYTAQFIPHEATAIDEVQGDNVQCTKVLRDGQIYIIRGEKVYTVMGQSLK